MIRSISFSSPLTPASTVLVSDGQRLPVISLLALQPEDLAVVVQDPEVRSQLQRLAAREMVLPGADRWRARVAVARPSDPVWVPALERNARVVEIEAARDALADPWQPARSIDQPSGELSVLGAVSRAWQSGDVEFSVRVPAGPGETRPGAYKLSSKDRRRMWEHLTGLVGAMEIQRGMVARAPRRPAGEAAPAVATIGLVGSAVGAAYLDSALAPRMLVREDGQFRRDQQERTTLAEQHAWVLRRWRAEGSPVTVSQWPLVEYDAIAGQDDLGSSVRSGGRAMIAVGVGALAVAGAALAWRSDTVRSWFASAAQISEGM